MSPKEFYSSQLDNQQGLLKALRKRISNLSRLRLVMGFVILVVGYLVLSEKIEQWWAILVAIAAFLVVVKRHNKLNEEAAVVELHIELLEKEAGALEGVYTSFKNGAEYIDSRHPYTFDLDFFGSRSIYQMLCRAATRNGEVALANLLNHPYEDAEQVVARQQIVKELSEKPEFLMSFRVAGAAHQEGEKDVEKITSWLQMEDKFVSSSFTNFLVIAIPVLTGGALVLSILYDGLYPALLLIVVFNWVFLRIKAQAIKEAAFFVARSAKLIEKYEALISVVASESFRSRTWEKEAGTALESITKLKKLAHLFESRYNGMVGPLMNSLFMFDIQCGVMLERWRREHRNKLQTALADIAELDVKVSLATFAYNNPNYTYPVFASAGTHYAANNFGHPLLGKGAVGNSFILGEHEQFYLLTGANMTGKSTFIRTVGVNLVLAYTGVPLRGEQIAVPLTRLYTGMRITDSVQDDVSYFRAELIRIQDIMKEVQQNGQPYLVLLDEPLRGTNTTDKQNGTRSIIEKLIKLSAIGIVATHDTVLCNLEDQHEGRVANYHFESSIEGGELKFDYQLKKGCSTSNNATILMQQMGIV